MKRRFSKYLLKTACAMTTAVFLTACGTVSETIEEHREASFEEKVVAWLTDLQAYQATASVSYISNKNVNHYEISHTVTRGGSYLIEVTGPERLAGNVSVSNGEHIFQLHRGLGHKFEIGTVYEHESRERTSLLLTNFADAFLDGGGEQRIVLLGEAQGANGTENGHGNGQHVLSVPVESKHRYIASLALVIDADFNPISLTSLDRDGQERIVVSYSSFVLNPEIDVSVFEIDSMEELASTTDETGEES